MFLPIVYAVFRFVSETTKDNKNVKKISYYAVCLVRILIAIELALVFVIL